MAFPCRLDPKLTRDGLGFKSNGPGKGNGILAFERCGRFFSDLLTKMLQEGVEGWLGKLLFWPTWARFPGTWVAVSSGRDLTLTRDGLGFKRNGPGKGNRTLVFGRSGQFFWTYLRRCCKKGPRVGWANFDFGQPGLDFRERGRQFPVARTLH